MMAAVAASVLLAAAASGERLLPVQRAYVRAQISTRAIARLSPLQVRAEVLYCTRRSRRTVDCVSQFVVAGRSSCNPSTLLIRVRFADPQGRRTVASYPRDPVCVPPRSTASGGPA